MAGESPDKAEQQESSEETTAGGGGRDPRLSVLRESASPVQVDQPTAVFRALTPRTPQDDAPAEPAEVTEPAESAESADSVDAAETVDAADETGAEGVGKSPESFESSESSESSESVESVESADAEDAEAAENAGDSAGGAAEDAAEGDRLRAAVAAWVATDAPGADSSSSDETASDDDSDDAGEGDAAEDAGAAAGEAAEAPRDADSEVADNSGASDASEGETGDDSAQPRTEPAPTDAVPAADSAAEAGTGDDTSDEPPASDADAPAGESWFARKPAAQDADGESPDTDADADAPADSGADAAPEPDPDPDPVDQPTAMFRAVRPPVVDQPTTALKMPVTPESAPPSAPKPAQERVSTFVPLRPETPTAASKGAPAAPGHAASTPVPPASLGEAERTRQQPMPPLPPLDLLAELTNTPPPPPTPMRTTMRRVRIWTPLVVLLLIVFAVVQFVRPLPSPTLTLSAAPTFTFEGGELQMPWPTEGQGAAEVEGVGSLGTYGPQKPAPLASVAKTMTAYVILRDHPIKGKDQGPEIEIDKKAADEAGAQFESTAAVKEGQKYTEKELLQLLMIPSANNVARRLARWDAGSEAAFVEKMNAAAKDLGMTDSTYTDPSGLEATTVSTPQDQLKLAKAVMQYDVFREIVNMPNLKVDGIPGQIENNNNIVLEPGVSGIKTGSSTPAGGNLLWSANTVIDGKQRRILGIVMGVKDAATLHEKLQKSIDLSLQLIQKAQKDVTSAAVVRKGQVVGYIDDGLGGRTPVVADKELKAVGWPGLKVDLDLTDGGKALPHTGKAGDVIGQVSIGTGTGKVSAPVSLQKDLVEPGFDKKLTRLG